MENIGWGCDLDLKLKLKCEIEIEIEKCLRFKIWEEWRCCYNHFGYRKESCGFKLKSEDIEGDL